MVILCSELFEKGDGLGKRLNALHGPVGHVDCRSPLTIDSFHVGAFRHQVENHFVVAARRRMVQRGLAFVIGGVDVHADLFDERCQKELGYLPYRAMTKLTENDTCLLPSPLTLQADGRDALDP